MPRKKTTVKKVTVAKKKGNPPAFIAGSLRSTPPVHISPKKRPR